MTNLILSAGRYYHMIHPGSILLYKLPEGYVVFGDDAIRVSKTLNKPLVILDGYMPKIVLSPDEYIDSLDLIGESQTISYRDDDGNLCIPDIQRLESERNFED